MAFDISKAFDKVWHSGPLHKLKPYTISGLVFGPISSFCSKDGFKWMESFHKNIQLILKFLKAPFLVVQFSWYILMTFLMMLSVILLSIIMILLSILTVIRHRICATT